MDIDILPDHFCELADKLLMDPSWRSHIIDLSVDQFGSLALGQGIDIVNSVSLFLR